MDDMSWFMLGLNKGRKEAGGIVNLHEIFLQQPVELEVPLIGEYKQVLKLMPDNCGQTANYQFSDYSNNTAEGHLFEVYQIMHTKPCAIGMFRGDEYLGIYLMFGMNVQCYTIYQPNSDYTRIYLAQDDIFKKMYEYELGNAQYNYSNVMYTSSRAKVDIERTTGNENGEVSKQDITMTTSLPYFGGFTYLQYPYADNDRIAVCIDEYARLCNAKYHEKI